MKQLLTTFVLVFICTAAFSQANTKLSNLVSPTAVNQHLLPNTTNARDLGSSSYAWRNLYLRGYVYLDGTRFLSNHPGTGSFNAFVGSNAGLAITTGKYNTVLGHDALRNDSIGSYNTAIGWQAMYKLGYGIHNTAVGSGSLFSSTTSSDNTAVGFYSLYYNTYGELNTAHGALALVNNTSGYTNAALGYASLYYNVGGSGNTGVGAYAGNNAHNYSNATFLGSNSTAADNLTNITAVGASAKALAPNQVMLGNTAVTTVVAAGGYYLYSDGRFKKNIQEDVPGLSFINKLRPVTYHYNIHGLNSHIGADMEVGNIGEGLRANEQQEALRRQTEEESIKAKEQILYTGFVAQEVETAAKDLKYDFSGLHKPAGDKDVYGLSYGDFVVPLVKAVQELSKANEETKAENKQLREEVAELRQMVLELKGGTGTVTSMSGSLEQNTPNPVAATTTIKYHIPEEATSAMLNITNAEGQLKKKMTLSSGTGQVSLNTAIWACGTYNYTLYVNGKPVNSKRLVIAR